MTLHLQGLVSATIVKATTALFRIKPLGGLFNLYYLELFAIKMVRLPTQCPVVPCSYLVFVDRLTRLIHYSPHVFLLSIAHRA